MMRIVGRSESSLETLFPMEKSWALEVEKEEETLPLQSRSEHLYRGGDGVKQIEASWVPCKRLNSGIREGFHRSRERESERYINRPSGFFDSNPYKNNQHQESSRSVGETERPWQFNSSSRCYPPSVNIGFSVSPGNGASELEMQRGLLESRKFARSDRTHDSFISLRHSAGSKDGFNRENQGENLSMNPPKRRQDRFASSEYRRRRTASVYKACRKSNDYVNDCSHFRAHQEPYESKHEFRPLFDRDRQYRQGQYQIKSEFLEHKSNQRGDMKMDSQAQSYDFTGQKNAKSCDRPSELEVKNQMGILHAGQKFVKESHVINDESTTSDAAAPTEDVLSEGTGMPKSSHSEGSEAPHDNSRVATEQYEMLACLLFDDLQDLDEVPDADGMDGGPCEISEFIFDNVSEVSMDTDSVREASENASEKASVAGSTMPSDCNFSGKTYVVKPSAIQHSKKFQDGNACLGLKKAQPVLIDVTNKFEITTSAPGVKRDAQEDDAHRLSQRQRQIDFGKNTLGYERYTELVPRIKRKTKDPQTPNPKQVCSKRSWDGQIRKWRRLLHVYDPPSEDGEEIAEDFSILKLHQSNLQNGADAKQDTSCASRNVEADESNGWSSAAKRKDVGDASLTIYEDWMES